MFAYMYVIGMFQATDCWIRLYQCDGAYMRNARWVTGVCSYQYSHRSSRESRLPASLCISIFIVAILADGSMAVQ